jgi:hypothetical protein
MGDFVITAVPLKPINDMPAQPLVGKIVLDTNTTQLGETGAFSSLIPAKIEAALRADAHKLCNGLASKTRVASTTERRPRCAHQTREQTKPVQPAAHRQSGHARRGCRNNDGRPNR